MTDVDAVLCDVGGVLNHTEFGRFANRLETHCDAEPERIHRIEHQTRIHQLDAGKITAKEYIERLQDQVGLRLSLDEYKDLLHTYVHWHHNLIHHFDDINTSTYVLSNNSSLFITDEKRSELGVVFNEQFYSFEVGARKPDAEIYEHAVREIDESQPRCVFIDDKQRNLDAAENFDLQTHLFTGQDDLLAFLHDI